MTESQNECGVRCECGRLLARRVPEGIELKCPRCRRIVVLDVARLGDAPVELDLQPPRTAVEIAARFE